MCIRLKNQSTLWSQLKNFKESDSVGLTEHAVANQLVGDPAFKWWVPLTLKKLDRVLQKAESGHHRIIQEVEIDFTPRTFKMALQVDPETGIAIWRDALMQDVKTGSETWTKNWECVHQSASVS